MLICYELTFKGTRDGLVYSRMILPKRIKSSCYFPFSWLYGPLLGLVRHAGLYTVAGYGVVLMDVRGQSGYSTDGDRSPLGNTVKDRLYVELWKVRWALYKDVYLDLYQLIEIVANLPSSRRQQTCQLWSLSRRCPGPGCCRIESNPTNGSHLSILIGFETCIRDWKHQWSLWRDFPLFQIPWSIPWNGRPIRRP